MRDLTSLRKSSWAGNFTYSGDGYKKLDNAWQVATDFHVHCACCLQNQLFVTLRGMGQWRYA